MFRDVATDQELWPTISHTRRWTAIVPFKGGAAAKSRLGQGTEKHLPLDPELRHQLAMAFLRDTVTAAESAACVGRIVVVSSDPSVAARLPEATVLSDPAEGLNAAVSIGFEWSREHAPDAPAAALTGDLPALRSLDLAAALDLARRHALSVVPDHLGIGTTMITALPGMHIAPRFGGNSYEAHRQAGHETLPVSIESTLRQDVDTPLDLSHALRRGAGAATKNAMKTRAQRRFKIA